MRLLHGVGSPRHSDHRVQRGAFGERHYQHLHQSGTGQGDLAGYARRAHRGFAQSPGGPQCRRSAADGPRLRSRDCRLAHRQVVSAPPVAWCAGRGRTSQSLVDRDYPPSFRRRPESSNLLHLPFAGMRVPGCGKDPALPTQVRRSIKDEQSG